jgi:hypothetical protein
MQVLMSRPRAGRAQSNSFAVGDERDFFAQVDLARPDLAEVRKAVESNDFAAAKKAWAHHLATRDAPRWLWSRRDRDAIKKVDAENFDGLGKYIAPADRLLARRFNFLGVRKQLAHDLDWQQGAGEWTDVLNRFEYWQTLGYAYWASGNEKYAADFVYLLKSWIAKNPVPAEVETSWKTPGTSWRTLETGIRAQNWFDAMQLFMDSPSFDADAKYLMTRSLIEHARRLQAHEMAFRAGNWQIAECAGLATVGIMLPEMKSAAAWRQRGLDYLVEHMRRDVYPDGGQRELTPGYHIWMINQFLSISLLARVNGYETPGLLQRHEKMFEFLMALSKPDRRVPPFGDSGSPSIVDAMGLGALVYGRADMRYLASQRCSESAIWLFGPGIFERYAKLKPSEPAMRSMFLPDSKYMVMRSGWDIDDRYLLLDAAPWGGVQGHHDRLQVVAYAGGRDLLVDPGNYSDDQPLSSTYFRTTEAHNVLMIDGQEQPGVDPQVLAWDVKPQAQFAAAAIEKNGFRQQRSVLFVKPDYWLVADFVSGPDEDAHEVKRLFHFPPGRVDADATSARTTFIDGTNIQVQAADEARMEMRKGWVPVSASAARESPVATLVSRTKFPATFCAVLTPFADAQRLPTITQVPDEPGILRLHLTTPDGQTDEIAMAENPTELRIVDTVGKGRAAVVRKGPHGTGGCVLGASIGR